MIRTPSNISLHSLAEVLNSVILEQVVGLLAEALSLEKVSVESFTTKTLLNLNTDPQGLPVAITDSGRAVGFMSAVTTSYPQDDARETERRGWITAFAVASGFQRQGIGTQLLEWSEQWLRECGCQSVLVSCYPSGYWIPGIEDAIHPTALEWLLHRGYEVVMRPLAMRLRFSEEWSIPLEVWETEQILRRQGVAILPYHPAISLAMQAFLRASFPGDWQRVGRQAMRDIVEGHRTSETLWTAQNASGEVIGFAQFEGARFGPIGVGSDWQGKGVGKVLMYYALNAMRSAGSAEAWFLWTNDTTAERFYRPAGFEPWRRFSVLKKSLTCANEQLPENGKS